MADRDEKDMFAASLAATGQINYLGDVETLDSLLEFWSAEFVEQLQKGKPTTQVARQIATRLGRILLGKNENYTPVTAWNNPGGIDTFCKKLFQFKDETPAAVMYHTVLTFLSSLCDLIVAAGAPEFLEETWQTKRKQLITKYTYIFRGVAPDQVAEYLMGDEQNEQQVEQRPVDAVG